MTIKIFVLFVLLGSTSLLFGSDQSYVKISVLSSGKLLLNGKAASLKQIDTALAKVKSLNGRVYYYREKAKSEPPPIATKVIKLIIRYRLPTRLSTKPDFSNYVGNDGKTHPVR